MLRRTAALAALTLAASLAAVVSSPAQAADPTLVVPDSPSGDVVVTATADPATAPYLQVRVTRGANAVAPYRGIAPAPVANADGAVELAVPTWGLHEVAASFVLLGCASSDPASCVDLLATAQRRVVQTATASASVELPDALPVFVPEEQVFITGSNEGGGRLEVSYGDVYSRVQPLTPDVRTEFTFPDNLAGQRDLIVSRCSTISTVPYCESPAVARVPVRYLREPGLHITMFGAYRPLTADPALSGSTRRVSASVSTAGHAFDLSWQLNDLSGQKVLGPIQVASNEVRENLDLNFSPGKLAGGVLADGGYDAVFTLTTTKGEITRSTTSTTRITIMNNPPRQSARMLRAVRKIYPNAAGHQAQHEGGLFQVEALEWEEQAARSAQFRIRDRAGRVVYTRTLWRTTWGPREPGEMWPDHIWEVYGIRFWQPGTYRAELTQPDAWGRPTTTALGPLYVMKKMTVRDRVTVTGASSRVSRHVYQARVPKVRGELAWYETPFVEVYVRGKGAGTVRTLCRVPSLSKAWQRNGWDGGGQWRNACAYHPPRGNPAGQLLQLRFTDKGAGAYRLRAWRMLQIYDAWFVTR